MSDLSRRDYENKIIRAAQKHLGFEEWIDIEPLIKALVENHKREDALKVAMESSGLPASRLLLTALEDILDARVRA